MAKYHYPRITGNRCPTCGGPIRESEPDEYRIKGEYPEQYVTVEASAEGITYSLHEPGGITRLHVPAEAIRSMRPGERYAWSNLELRCLVRSVELRFAGERFARIPHEQLQRAIAYSLRK